MAESLRILGIDPGSRTTGYGIVDRVGSKIIHVDNGCLTTKAADPLPQRLDRIYRGLLEAFAKYKPDVVAIEEVFFAKNASSSIKLGEARGVALLASIQSQIPIFEYATREVKQSITGYGQATKDQIQKMVKALLGLPEVAQEDASDALAIAICHSHSYRMKKVMVA